MVKKGLSKVNPSITVSSPDSVENITMQRLATSQIPKMTVKNGVRLSSQVAQRQYYDVEKLGFTETGYPRFPKGTRINDRLIMGDYGPYDPKLREKQEYFQKQIAAGVPSYLVYPFDRALFGIAMLALVYIAVSTTLMCFCFASKKFCKYIPFQPKN